MLPHHLPRPSSLAEGNLYEYPHHLREQVISAPPSHGIYKFHGRANAYPLYIGKSVNLRSRLLTHLRNRNETRLLSQTVNISYIQTAGEISSLLLEARLIKAQKPLFNRRLRKLREVFSYIRESDRLIVSPSTKNQYGRSSEIYGLFKNKTIAIEKLRNIADAHKLCLNVLGIDKGQPNHPCFRYSINKCAGACCGAESIQAHNNRLISALNAYKIALWPYKQRIAIVEKHGDLKEFHVLDHWIYQGSYQSLDDVNKEPRIQNASFDADMYKILVKPIITNSATIIQLE